jgi:hypothetical protein
VGTNEAEFNRTADQKPNQAAQAAANAHSYKLHDNVAFRCHAIAQFSRNSVQSFLASEKATECRKAFFRARASPAEAGAIARCRPSFSLYKPRVARLGGPGYRGAGSRN